MLFRSGASTTWGATSSSNYAGFSSKPDDKYYDDYTSTTLLTACNGGICYGHALSETSNWYNDYFDFVYAYYPWFMRGGYYYNGANAGVFSFNSSNGNANDIYGFRSVVSFVGA